MGMHCPPKPLAEDDAGRVQSIVDKSRAKQDKELKVAPSVVLPEVEAEPEERVPIAIKAAPRPPPAPRGLLAKLFGDCMDEPRVAPVMRSLNAVLHESSATEQSELSQGNGSAALESNPVQ